MDFTNVEGRERILPVYPEPLEMQPDYTPNVEYNKRPLTKGAVVFQNMSSRKPNMNLTYGEDKTFYT